MNKIVKMIHKNRQLRDQIIAACEEDGAPLTPQALNAWKQLRDGVPAKRVQTVARVPVSSRTRSVPTFSRAMNAPEKILWHSMFRGLRRHADIWSDIILKRHFRK